MKLSDYLDLGNTDAASFAKRLGVTPKAVIYWLSGDRTPRPEQMQKIVEATNGAVTPNDFLPPFRGDESAPLAVRTPAQEAQADAEVNGAA